MVPEHWFLVNLNFLLNLFAHKESILNQQIYNIYDNLTPIV